MSSPKNISLVASLISSYFTFSNIGLSYFSIMPATERGQTNIPVADRVALWEFSYRVGKIHMASSGLISALAISASAYLTDARPLRNVLTAGALAAFTSAAFTIIFLLPVNNNLIAMHEANAVKPMGQREQQHALDQLDKWRELHRFRVVAGIIPWLASTIALLATDSIIQL
ncbi:hypothetical protein DFH06DRAFT_1156608 [Mycena polygramma]|nr:hypothetical protein DFH06DRAFT_1156608 [Mycena polygramma]